ncbi:MAG TPA: ChrR family anti-sigma-E factor [Stellaceae bacterium]|nr:ChrR family anti-sigma-E factor [Stellaceae bacterium]
MIPNRYRPRHHPTEDHLVDYATGALDTPVSLLVATHLTLCPGCRRHVALLEGVGGALLEGLDPAALGAGCRAAVMARLGACGSTMEGAKRPDRRALCGLEDIQEVLPRPLLAYLSDHAAAGRPFAWCSLTSGLQTIDLTPWGCRARTRLMRIRAGATMPRHSHGGTEMLCILAGGYSDGSGYYAPGDVLIMDAGAEHQPVADPGEDCICLAVTAAPGARPD